MMHLTVTLQRLRDAVADSHWVDEAKKAIIDQIEKMGWLAKKPSTKRELPLDKIALTFGLPFALWALRCAEPVADANRAGRLMALDMAFAALDAHPDKRGTAEIEFLTRLRNCVLSNASLEPLRASVFYLNELANIYIKSDRLDDEISWALAEIQVRALHGGDSIDPAGDWSEGGLYGAENAVSDLSWLLVRADPRYANARRIAELAYAMEKRWQDGTRLDFEFSDEIVAEIDALERSLEEAHKERAWGLAWQSWNLHVKGEVTPPAVPVPLVSQPAGDEA